jgi:hypothetical protein
MAFGRKCLEDFWLLEDVNSFHSQSSKAVGDTRTTQPTLLLLFVAGASAKMQILVIIRAIQCLRSRCQVTLSIRISSSSAQEKRLTNEFKKGIAVQTVEKSTRVMRTKPRTTNVSTVNKPVCALWVIPATNAYLAEVLEGIKS